MIRTFRANPIVLSAAVAMMVTTFYGCSAPQAPAPNVGASTVHDLRAGFKTPPDTARPRTWWHWLNGNITKDGIAADLAWMDRIGMGGVQMFDANLGTPVIVENRLPFMSEGWKSHFRFALETANSYGLEVAIAGSPGWSETGGPWVPPEDGMKKLVWSEVLVAAGETFEGRLPDIPSVTGPYQMLHLEPELGSASQVDVEIPSYSETFAVLAYPSSGGPIYPDRIYSQTGTVSESLRLTDTDQSSAAKLQKPQEEIAPDIVYEFDEPVTIRSATLFLPDGRPPFGVSPYLPKLQAEQNGTWEDVAELTVYDVPITVGFNAVTGKRFRLLFDDNPSPAPGLDAPVEGAVAINIFAREETGSIAIGDFVLSTEERVHLAEVRAGFAVESGFDTLPDPVAETADAISMSDIIDLTDDVGADGELSWKVPDDRTWRIVRYGYSLTGKTNHPANAEATGLEVDKFDGAAVRRYLDNYLGMYRDAAGDDLVGNAGLKAFLTDSIEVDASNWTPQMIDRFKQLRGYDPTPFLPVLTGRVVGGSDQTEGFLADWRWTLEDLLADEHYKTISDFTKDNQLSYYGEALENGRPVYGDDLQMRQHADIPMAALWSWQRGGKPRSTLVGDMRGAASVANIYGKDYVAAESMTSAFAPWAFAPADLKRFVDFEFANGINRIVVHTSVHQPSDEVVPGLSLAIFGQYFNRHDTWAEMAQPWIDYISRSSFLLQRGRTVADIAVFAGEDLPITQLYYAEDGFSELPVGYGFDFVNAEIIETILRVEDTKLETPGDAQYRVLYLRDGAKMRLATLMKISNLVDEGAIVIGQRPAFIPSLNDNEVAFERLVSDLWDTGRIKGADSIQSLAREGISPDVSGLDADVHYIHRQDGLVDIYFISNQANVAKSLSVNFRVNGRAPELWNPVDGSMVPMSYTMDENSTRVSLDLAPEQAAFVVFAEKTNSPSLAVDEQAQTTVATIDGPWEVTFQANRGAPHMAHFEGLQSLSENENPGIRYFSGIATYRSTFELDTLKATGEPVWMDLGVVGDVAEVSINGRTAGIAWLDPYRVDVGPHLKLGQNNVEIQVANVWVNRLIGDAQPDTEKTAQVFAPTYYPDAPLRISGLVGPVGLVASQPK